MYYKSLDHPETIRQAFMNRFVLSWDAFQTQHKDWIAKMAKTNHPVTQDWYHRAFMWEKMDSKYQSVSMKDAIAFLKEQNGNVFFITEGGDPSYCRLVDFTAEADARILAARIAHEWYDGHRLGAQNRYNPDALFPEEVYVFDASMKWCVAFTHETTDWEAELDDPMRVAESRVCILCKG